MGLEPVCELSDDDGTLALAPQKDSVTETRSAGTVVRIGNQKRKAAVIGFVRILHPIYIAWLRCTI